MELVIGPLDLAAHVDEGPSRSKPPRSDSAPTRWPSDDRSSCAT